MNLLTGEYRNTIDDKGRLLFPARLRSSLDGNVLVVTQGIDRCLMLFTPEAWTEMSSKVLENASPFNERNRLVLRRFIAPAQEVEFDKSGRISIPQSLRDYACLSKDCVLLGVTKYLELWDAEKYSEYLVANEDAFCGAAEELGAITL